MTDAAQSGASADAVKDEGTAAGNGVICEWTEDLFAVLHHLVC